jgi:hypothetical protein
MNKGRYSISTRLGSFKRYCEQKDFNLMIDDYRFIDECLSKCHRSEFKAILVHYLEEWASGMAFAESAPKAQGEGRRRANIWLLEMVKEETGKRRTQSTPHENYCR